MNARPHDADPIQTAGPAVAPAVVAALSQALQEEIPGAVQLRHELHRHPDLSGKEEPTVRRVLAALETDEAVDVAGGRLVRVGGAGPAVGLRAELDALPVTERTGLPWASTNGSAHLCGHDVHLAALVAVTRAVRRTGAPVPLVAVFQPREEAVPSGAADIVASGVLSTQGVGAMVAVHVQPRIGATTFSCVPGAVNASSDDFAITLHAYGGHAGYPHTTGDPVLAAAEIVVAIQGVVARQIDPVRPVVVTVGMLQAGDAPNVIPSSARLSGTIRAFDPADRDRLIGKIRQLAEHTAERHSCRVDVAIDTGEPPLANDPTLAATVGRWVARTGRTGVDLRSCGADDFSYYGQVCPSAMVFYGVGDAAPTSPGLHHPQFAPSDDDVAGVAECLLAGYLAGAELLSTP